MRDSAAALPSIKRVVGRQLFEKWVYPKKQNPRLRKESGVLNGGAWQCPTFTGNTTDYHRR